MCLNNYHKELKVPLLSNIELRVDCVAIGCDGRWRSLR